jgi:hypothetical protein
MLATTHDPRRRPRRSARSTVPVAVALVGVVLVAGACSDPPVASPSVGAGTLALGDEVVDLDVHRCALLGADFGPAPGGRTETTVEASGGTSDDVPVEVTVRRTGATSDDGEVQTVEITLGDPRTAVRAYVLYAAQDPEEGSWSTIAPASPTARAPLAGPLLQLDDARVVAEGIAADPGDGTPVPARLEATCPVGGDPSDLAWSGTPG